MAERGGALRAVLLLTVVLSACSLLYELLIAQALSLAAGNTVVWYSLTVGVYLGALGLGAVILSDRAHRGGWRTLFTVELLLSAVGALAVLVVRVAHDTALYLSATGSAGRLAPFLLFGASLVMIVAVGLLSGIELPVLIRLGNEAAPGPPVTNRVLAWDYAGALLGGLLFPLVLVPSFDLAAVGFGTALVNLAAGAWILLRFAPRGRLLAGGLAAVAVVGAGLAAGLARGDELQGYFLDRYYFYETAAERGVPFGPLEGVPEVERVRSPYQTIDLVRDPSRTNTFVLGPAYSEEPREGPPAPRGWYLFLGGDFQLASDYEEVYHEWFAHVPVLVNGAVPERVLVLGGGDGLLIRELLKHDGIRTVDHVELDRTMVEVARTHPVLTALNRGALDDPRVHTRFGDAFQFVRRAEERWDAIYLDFPAPLDYDLSKLYSREFYRFVRGRLAPGGYAVLDAPTARFERRPGPDGLPRLALGGDGRIYHETLRSAGFQRVVPFHTRLETDNPRAFEILEAWAGTPAMDDIASEGLRSAMRREWMLQYIEQNLDGLEQAFLLAWPEAGEGGEARYRELGVELRVLDEPRFGLALLPPLDPATAVDTARANSILRPTLPTRPVWSVRRPW